MKLKKFDVYTGDSILEIIAEDLQYDDLLKFIVKNQYVAIFKKWDAFVLREENET